MNALDTRINALSNNIAGTSEKKKGYTEDETEKDFLDSKLTKDKTIANDDANYDERNEAVASLPPLPPTENETLNNDKTVTETETLSLVSDFGKDAKENGNMEAPKGTGNTIMNDTPDDVSRYENKLYLNKDMESSVSLIGLEIIWVFKGGGIGTWWIGTLL